MSIITFKNKAKEETQKRVNQLIEEGAERLTPQDFKNYYLSRYGLKISFSGHYYNTLNSTNWLECQVHGIDEIGEEWYNTKGKFYQEELKKETEKAQEFRRDKQILFCLSKGHIATL